MAQLRYWVWLTTLEGVSSVTIRRLMDRFGGPREIFFGSCDDMPELSARERAALSNRDLSRTEAVLEKCRANGIGILTIADALYPERLRQISDPPPVLYVRGSLPFVDELPAVALVGTRRATPYGLKIARQLGQEITAGGGCVVTGMAAGVDAAAARGALMENGPCVGVLGTAIDVDYPAENAPLIADVASVGAIVSEFPPGYPTQSSNFPRRNRIISGLSCATCVVEAPRRSGALITADLALEQGRDLFAVPGNVDSPNSAGTNALIRDCARAVTCGEDILAEYEGLYPYAVRRGAETFRSPEPGEEKREDAKSAIDKPPGIPYIDVENRIADFPDDQKAILRALKDGETHIDEVIAATGFSAAKVLSTLTLLVIRGAVRSHPGKRYSLNV